MTVIDNFSGRYAFLSNFYEHPMQIDGLIWPTVEHYYQAAKTQDIEQSAWIRSAPTAKEAKTRGRKVEIRPDWDQRWRYVEMMIALEYKFGSSGTLMNRLMDTGGALLVEGNTWHDNMWGVCRCDRCGGVGKNMLGIFLMLIRDAL